MLNFLKSHKERTIIVRGNHSTLMNECLARGFWENHDLHNRTPKTILDLAGVKDYTIKFWGIENVDTERWLEACKITSKKLKPIYKRSVNYFETQNYIFCHAWIPTTYQFIDNPAYEGMSKLYRPQEEVYDPDWRKAPDWVWNEAMWSNPFKKAQDNLNQSGKTLVVGHWNCSEGWFEDEMEKCRGNDSKLFEICRQEDELCFGKSANWNPYYGNNFIAIDACTAVSGKVNVLVLEDELLEEVK